MGCPRVSYVHAVCRSLQVGQCVRFGHCRRLVETVVSSTMAGAWSHVCVSVCVCVCLCVSVCVCVCGSILCMLQWCRFVGNYDNGICADVIYGGVSVALMDHPSSMQSYRHAVVLADGTR